MNQQATSSIDPATTPAWLPSALVLACGTFAMGTDSFVLAGILPQISAGLAVPESATGQVVTAFALTYAVAAPVLAAATARVPRKLLMALALIVFALANLGSAFSPNLTALLVSRVIAALGAALFTPTASAAAAALAGAAKRGQALSVILSGLTVGTVFGVPLGTAIGQQWGWHATLLFVAAIAVLALLALLVTLPALAAPAMISLRQRLGVLKNLRLLAIIAVNLVSTIGGFMVYTYAAQILGATAGLTGTSLALALLAWGIGSSVGSLASGWMSDRFGASPTLVGATICLGVALFGLGLATGFLPALLVMAVFGAAGWSINTPVNHRLIAATPASAGVVISFNASGAYLGQAIGALTGGTLLASGIASPTLCFAGAAIAIAALLIQLATMRGERG